jgi:hypothetical protein
MSCHSVLLGAVVLFPGILPAKPNGVTAEPLCKERLKGLLNGEAFFALVRRQVPHGDERIEPYVGHANRNPPKFLIVLPRAIFW